MKKTITYSLLAACLISSSFARTWTSADGSKNFEADFVSGDSESVTVKKGNKNITLKLSILSETDQEWTKETIAKIAQQEADKVATEEFITSKFGKFLKKTKKFDGRRYKKSPFENIPEYFLLYYSASW